MMRQTKLPTLGIAAFSGTGKTRLLVKLIPLLKTSGLRLGVIKHAHHNVEVDHPGKDSYLLRKAGAGRVLLASSRRWALMVEEADKEPDLDTLLKRLDPTQLDLVLVEGFRHLRFPKIELHRPALGKPLLFPDDPTVIAFATDAVVPPATRVPLLDINDAPMIRDFILHWLKHRSEE
jgi:molybdopterin-guanine dinucleotide biosynthesis protein MobB